VLTLAILAVSCLYPGHFAQEQTAQTAGQYYA